MDKKERLPGLGLSPLAPEGLEVEDNRKEAMRLTNEFAWHFPLLPFREPKADYVALHHALPVVFPSREQAVEEKASIRQEDLIYAAAAAHFGVTESDIRGYGRDGIKPQARHAAVYLISKEAESYADTARKLNRDSTTIRHSVERVRAILNEGGGKLINEAALVDISREADKIRSELTASRREEIIIMALSGLLSCFVFALAKKQRRPLEAADKGVIHKHGLEINLQNIDSEELWRKYGKDALIQLYRIKNKAGERNTEKDVRPAPEILWNNGVSVPHNWQD